MQTVEPRPLSISGVYSCGSKSHAGHRIAVVEAQPEQLVFEAHCRRFGLRPEDHGKFVEVENVVYALHGIDPDSDRPILLRGNRGVRIQVSLRTLVDGGRHA
jgi:hypothetical protein